MTERRRQSLIWITLAVVVVLGIILISRLCAGEKDPTEVDVIGGGPNGEGEHPFGAIAIPPGSRRVIIRVNRAAFSRPDSEVSVRLEVLIRGEWVFLKQTGRAPGGVIVSNGQPRPFSYSYVTLPADAVEIRGVLSVFGSPAHVPTTLVFE